MFETHFYKHRRVKKEINVRIVHGDVDVVKASASERAGDIIYIILC